ncbi:hypothetical protein [Achromobacter xylosoxidans]|uniref:hypothetical protein n=1 Tax=Alcaligenes xylosoxydans xylosoxydans TaxID=85698 RepID=UPI001F0CFB95|nr:hypothetical protein [Achromobacter xylosoxidans]MCH4576191.1 hypothetical protein [Achromobacter xylosoxidans]MCZ8436857.1 hypothetical protein [Achromobacter xylosoxidans]
MLPDQERQLITDRVAARIRNRIIPAARYLATDDFESRLIEKECRQLLDASPYYGHLVYGIACTMWGNEDGVRYHFRKALEAQSNDLGQALFFHAQSLSNLGHFSEALALLQEALAPQNGFFTDRAALAPAIGAFHTLKLRAAEAERMNIQLPDSFPAEAARKAAELLESYGTSDADVAAVLDVAGEVLRRRRLFFLGKGPRWSIVDHPELHAVHFLYEVDQTVDEVADMNFEFAELLARRDGAIPESVVVSFTGRRS